MKPPASQEESMEMMTTDNPDFMALGSDASLFTKYSEQLQWIGVTVKESKVIDYTEDGRIAYIRHPGNTEMFNYYEIFSWQFVIATLIAISVLSLFMVRHKFTVKVFIETCMEVSSLTLTKSFPSSIQKCDHISRMVLGPILLLLIFTIIEFCNLILDEKVKKIPDRIIDSWDDLAQWKNVWIYAIESDFINEFVTQDNDMARNFAERYEGLKIDMWMNKEFLTDLAMNITRGDAVFIKNKLTLIFLLMRMAIYNRDTIPGFS